MIFTITNRKFTPATATKAAEFTSDRNPQGNTFWWAPGKPLDNAKYWTQGTRDGMLAAIRGTGKPVVLFVHGFNESFDRDQGIMQALVDSLGDLFTPVSFSWPSAGNELEYLQDREKAQKSAEDLLDALMALNCPNVIAHSMGNYLLQLALQKAPLLSPCVSNLVMVAADLPFDVLDSGQSNIPQQVKHGTVMYSSRDGALLLSAGLHVGERLGEGGPGDHPPANFTGVNCRTKMPWYVPPIEVHGYYFQSKECMGIMRAALQQ